MRQIYKIIVNVEQKKKKLEVLAELKKSVFLPPISQAEVAQLVEHNLAKVGVASSSLVFRSNVETQCIASLCVLKQKSAVIFSTMTIISISWVARERIAVLVIVISQAVPPMIT